MKNELLWANTTVVAILHDLNLALSFADRFLFMKEGVVRYKVENAFQLTPAIIEEIFGVSAAVIHHQGYQKPVVLIHT